MASAVADRIVSQPHVNARHFGCKGDGSDETDIIQAAINRGIALNQPVLFPDAEYTYSDTIWLTGSASETDDSTYQRSAVLGVGRGYGDSSSQRRTMFRCTAKDRPAFAIQRGRAIECRDWQSIGPNEAPESQDATSGDRSDWLTTDVQHTRFAPQCGLAIDPCLASDPGSGYSAFSYVGSSEGSNDISLRNVHFRNHAVGLVVRPDGGLAQVDQINFDDVRVDYCATAFGLGNSQMRSSSVWSKLTVGQCHTVLDSLSFGDGQGVMPTVVGLQVGGAWRVFYLNTAFGGGSITGLYAESTNWLGVIGNGTATGRRPLTFVDINFQRQASLDEDTAVPIWAHFDRPVHFVGGTILQGHQDADVLPFSGGYSPVFDGVHFANTNNTNGVRIIGGDFNGAAAPILRNCTTRVAGGTYPITPDGLNWATTRVVGNEGSNRFWWVRSTGLFRSGDSVNIETVRSQRAPWQVNDSTASSIDVTDGTLTWDTTDQPLLLAGDLIYGVVDDPNSELPYASIVPLFKVTTVGSTVTARHIGDPAWCSAHSSIRIYQPEWAPLVDFEGDTNSSTSITNTTHDGVVKVGDWIAGSGIPNHTRVTAVDDGANTITISRAATATATGVQLYWGRLYSLDTTAVF